MNGKLGPEEELIVLEFEKRNIPVELYTKKCIKRRSLPLDSSSLVVGDMDSIYGAMKQLCIEIPRTNSYPESLRQFLFRRISVKSLKEIESSIIFGNSSRTFIKPFEKQKRFTGFVVESEQDFYQVAGVSRNLKIWSSDVVEWLSEWRVYVVEGEVRSINYYDGDRNVPIDLAVIKEALKLLSNNGESYAGFAIDFGVLNTGETALVEMNDGFAVGAYNIDAKNYTDMIMARWNELLNTI